MTRWHGAPASRPRPPTARRSTPGIAGSGWGEYGDDDMVQRIRDLDEQLGLRDQRDEVRNVTIRPIRITIDVDERPSSSADAYLRLHLLSHRLAAPQALNMDGTFGVLNNVAWTNLGPVAVDELDDVRLAVRKAGRCSPCTGSTSSRG